MELPACVTDGEAERTAARPTEVVETAHERAGAGE